MIDNIKYVQVDLGRRLRSHGPFYRKMRIMGSEKGRPPVPGRRELLVSTAVDIIAEKGMKGLSHLTVDARAGVPRGSTSNYFRTREALVGAVLDHIEASYTQALDMEEPADTADLSQIGDALVSLVHRLLSDEYRSATRARQIIAYDADGDSTENFVRLRNHCAAAVERAGVTNSTRCAITMWDYLEGVMAHALTVKGYEIDDAQMRAVMDCLTSQYR